MGLELWPHGNFEVRWSEYHKQLMRLDEAHAAGAARDLARFRREYEEAQAAYERVRPTVVRALWACAVLAHLLGMVAEWREPSEA